MRRTLSIGITTRNRPEALRACLESLALLEHLSPEVLVYDDGLTIPIERQLDGVSIPFAYSASDQATAPSSAAIGLSPPQARSSCSCSTTMPGS